MAKPGTPDRLALLLSADPSAEVCEGKIVRITLMADGVVADQKAVSLSVRVLKGNPGVRLTIASRAALRGGGRATLEARLQRIDYDGPVTLKAEKLPVGVTSDAVDVPAGEDSAFVTLRAGPDVGKGFGKTRSRHRRGGAHRGSPGGAREGRPRPFAR